MDGRTKGLLETMVDGIYQYSELQAVNEYRNTSSVYLNAQKAVLTSDQPKCDKESMQAMDRATSFAQMVELSGRFDVERQPFLARCAVKTVCTVGSYFSPQANFAYYAIQLRSDIINFAVDKGYKNLETEQKTYSPRHS